MNKRKILEYNIKKKVLIRDDYTCQKCGKHTNLEIHHIIPVYKEGKDILTNLITLCNNCHKYCPDDLIEFISYLSKKLPFDLEKSKAISKFLVMAYFKKYNLLDKFNEQEIDIWYTDLWIALNSNDISKLSKLFIISEDNKNN